MLSMQGGCKVNNIMHRNIVAVELSKKGRLSYQDG